MDFIAEFLMEIYLGLVEILVPEHKFKKWQETLLKLAGILISIAILGCIFAGACLISEAKRKSLGIILLSVGCGMLAVQIALFIIVLVHDIKEEKAKKKTEE